MTSIKAKVAAAIDQGAGISCRHIVLQYFDEHTLFSALLQDPDTPFPAGVMIWEVGQDCRFATAQIFMLVVLPLLSPSYFRTRFRHRRNPVLRDGQTHVATCSRDSDSLLLAISDVLASRGVQRASFISSEQDSDEL